MQDREESDWARVRILYTLINNAHYKQKKSPKDWIKLSFDKDDKGDIKKPSLKRAKQLLGSKFKLHGN